MTAQFDLRIQFSKADNFILLETNLILNKKDINTSQKPILNPWIPSQHSIQ